MRVLHLCKSFSKLSETFIYDYVTEQARQGLDVSVVTHRRANSEQRPFEAVTVLPWPSDWNPERISYRVLEWLGIREKYTSYWSLLRPRLRTEIRRIAPDVIHAHFGRPGAMIAPVAEQMGVPLVVTFYGYDISELPRQQRWRDAYQNIWHTAAAVIVLSEEMKQRAVQWGAPPGRTRVVHLARDLDAFPYRLPSAPVRKLVSVGRLTEKKGHRDAIGAVKKTVPSGYDLQLRIVGDGPLRGALERHIQAHDLQDRVTLVGAVPNAEVAHELRTADAFILCSKTAPSGDREGTPTVLIEAQAVGLPCISTRHAGIPEMIPVENHRLLAEEGNVDAIATRLRWLCGRSQQELNAVAEAGRKKVEVAFNLAGEVGTLRAIYREVVSTGS